ASAHFLPPAILIIHAYFPNVPFIPLLSDFIDARIAFIVARPASSASRLTNISQRCRTSVTTVTRVTHPTHTCELPLEECLNCGAFGHTWNFCHLGARRLYFALCHNCQKWHLPSPCEEDLVRCGGCLQLGHQQEFCAINPSPSHTFTNGMSEFISHNLTAHNAQWILHNAALAEEIYKIKMGAVMDTLRLSTGRNHEEVRACLANAYRGRPQSSGPTSYHLVPAQSSTSRQLPTPAAVRMDINSGLSLPRPSIPPAQAHNQSYEDDNTLAPLQLQKGGQQRHQQTNSKDTIQPVTVGSSLSSSTKQESEANSGVPKTLAEPQTTYDSIHNFRMYDGDCDGGQVELDHNSPGDASFSPRSSPCDNRADSTESKDEVEQEREFFEGSIY
ncbi:unnamed protein product, partial [Aureobasidium mustum]